MMASNRLLGNGVVDTDNINSEGCTSNYNTLILRMMVFGLVEVFCYTIGDVGNDGLNMAVRII